MGGGFGRGSSGSADHQIRKVTLKIDGVFFTDGGFAGPNATRLWEQVVSDADAHIQLSQIARRAHESREDAGQILDRLEQMIRPLPDYKYLRRPPSRLETADEFREHALQRLAAQFMLRREQIGAERAVETILGWADAPVPRFYKLL